MSGTVIDKATAFKNSLTGSGINKIVCKASSHEVNGPKKKHVDFLIGLTEDQRVSMPELADMMLERTRNGSWVVVFKALISTHNLLVLGNERFMQCMASRPTAFGLDSYTDKSTPQAYNMSVYIRRYAKYLRSYCHVYRQLAMDVMKAKKGENGDFQAMDHQQLLKAISLMDGLVEAHLELNMNVIDMVNGVINTCFLMLYKDLVRLYQVYNDAMISLLEKFFEMKRAHAKEAFDLYKKCPEKLESMKKFFELAEDLGLETKSHLNLKPVPNELLPALEEHLKDMEKKGFTSSSTSEAAASIKLKLREAPARDTSASVATSTPPSVSASDFLEEQKKKLEEFSRHKAQTKGSSTPPPKATPNADTSNHKKQSASVDDLLGLDFTSPSDASSGGQWPTQVSVASTNPFGSGGYQEVDFFKPQPSIPGGQGSMQVNFEAAFGSPGSTQNSSFGTSDLLQPERIGGPPTTTVQTNPVKPAPLGSSVDQGLASTVQQLTLGSGSPKTGAIQKTHHQWKPPTEMKLTGGPNWQQTGLQATTLPPSGHYGYGAPMGGVMPTPGWGTGTTPMYGMQHPGMGMGMQVGMGPAMQPGIGMGYGAPQGYGIRPMGMQQQPASSNPFGSSQAPF